MNPEESPLPRTQGQQSRSIALDCLEIQQPIGVFYSASIPFEELIALSYVDTRKIVQKESTDGLDSFLGIQRKLSPSREKELRHYVNTYDACFPTAIILSVPERCAEYNPETKRLTLAEYRDNENSDRDVPYFSIASILDGQHRIAGLHGFDPALRPFELNVSIFLELDPSTEAYLFSVVNQAQTKVNKSLVYDLYSLATTRSPQRLCHQIAVTLNEEKGSPFKNKIKRLGSAIPSTRKVSITQAAFVESLLKLMSHPPTLAVEDRDLYMKGKKPVLENQRQTKPLVFREMMIEEMDAPLTTILWNYFTAVNERWSEAWNSEDQGTMLGKTNGFMALMRFLEQIYLYKGKMNEVVTIGEFLQILNRIDLKDSDFNTQNYKPGTSGEASLFNDFMEGSGMATIS